MESGAKKPNGIQAVLARYPAATEEQMIAILQDVQESCGYISPEAVLAIGRHFNVPASKVYGVATFYNQFRFEPLGKVHVQLCRGTACHVKGSLALLELLEKSLGIPEGSTTPDGMFSYECLACIGACGLSPAMTLNGELKARVSAETLPGILDEYRARVEAAL